MAKKEWFVVALDTGNGELKVVSDAVSRLRVGGVLGRVKETEGRTKISSGSTLTTYEVEGDPQKWVIGYHDVDRIKAEPLSVAGREGMQRYNQPLYATYAKIGLALGLGEERPSKILLVTSTPARDALDNKILENLNDLLTDAHKVKINGERVIMNVMKYESMSETEASLYDVYLDNEGYVADETIEKQDVLVINAGFGTTDVSRYNNLEYIPLDRETIKVSYLDVLQRVREWLEKTVGKEIRVQEVARQLSEQMDQAKKKFVFVDEEVDGFHDVYKKAVDDVFQDLRAELNLIVPDPDLFPRIRVVGGAAADTIWGEHFKKWSKRVEIPADPQFSSARGMYRYGKYLANELSGKE